MTHSRERRRRNTVASISVGKYYTLNSNSHTMCHVVGGAIVAGAKFSLFMIN